MKRRQTILWAPRRLWLFESSGDNEVILFYPHGWGRAYLVPSEERRREIEAFLTLWLMRSRSTIRTSRWILLSAVVLGFVTIFLPGRHDIPGSYIVFPFAFVVLALGCLLFVAIPLVLMFLAETAKADLEKAEVRKPLGEFLRHHAQRSDWSLLCVQGIFSSLIIPAGIWLLWPVKESVMAPARVSPTFLAAGILLIIMGAGSTLFKVWQIKIKLRG